MEPIPETVEAIDEFGPFAEIDLLECLNDMANQLQDTVPDCVGLSLAYREYGVSFTLIATDQEIAALDGAQHPEGAPCVDGAKAERMLESSSEDQLGEAEWQHFAQFTTAAGIASTLTMPILAGAHIVGSVDLYAATPRAFAGHHEAIAEIFSAWAPGAVANADLSFSTRAAAEQAPQKLRDDMRIQVAVGILMKRHNVGVAAAREQLGNAARRAGAAEAALAERLIAGVAHGEHELEE